MYWWLFLLCPLAYLFGGLNISKCVARLRHVDLSKVGSGNAGATNIGRAMGFKWFLLVTVLEACKCAIIVLGGYLFSSLMTGVWVYTETHFIVMLAMGLAAIIGVVFPVWYKFKGGKGIATWLGVSFFLNPLVMLGAAAMGIPLLMVTHIMSISTLLGVLFWVGFSVWLELPYWGALSWPVVLLYCSYILVLFFSHRKNIVRIFTGTEKKFMLHKDKKDKKTANSDN